MAKEIQLSAIRTDGGTQMRAELNRDVFMDYRDKWLAGEKFPDVVLFHDGSAHWLADGFHRFYGAREAKLKTIPADVRQGTVRDAILFAVAANQQHGLRRTNADKRRAVEALLNDEEWVLWSDVRVSELAGVSDALVRDVRKQLRESRSSSPAAKAAGQPRTGKDGKKRKPRRPAKPKQLPTPSPPSSHMNNNTGNSGGSKPSSSDASAVAPRLHQLHKSIDAIFAPLGKLERKQLVQYINSKYAA